MRAFLVGGPLAGAALLILAVFFGGGFDREPGAGTGAGAGAGVGAGAGAVLAPGGFVGRNIDAFAGPELRLGLVDGQGAGILCTIGQGSTETTTGVAPLAQGECHRADAGDLEAPARGSIAEAQPLGDATYHISAAGELVVARGEGQATAAPMPAEPDAIHVCYAGDTRVVAIDGNLVHGIRQTAVAFVDFAAATAVAPATLVETHVYDYHLGCREDEARLTWLEAALEGESPYLVVQQVRCTPGGCEASQNRRPREGTDAVVAALGGDVLLVYARDGQTRMRMAPVGTIDGGDELEVPLDGPAPVLSRKLYARSDAAIVTLRTTDGVRALRVGPRGLVRPLRVATGTPLER